MSSTNPANPRSWIPSPRPRTAVVRRAGLLGALSLVALPVALAAAPVSAAPASGSAVAVDIDLDLSLCGTTLGVLGNTLGTCPPTTAAPSATTAPPTTAPPTAPATTPPTTNPPPASPPPSGGLLGSLGNTLGGVVDDVGGVVDGVVGGSGGGSGSGSTPTTIVDVDVSDNDIASIEIGDGGSIDVDVPVLDGVGSGGLSDTVGGIVSAGRTDGGLTVEVLDGDTATIDLPLEAGRPLGVDVDLCGTSVAVLGEATTVCDPDTSTLGAHLGVCLLITNLPECSSLLDVGLAADLCGITATVGGDVGTDCFGDVPNIAPPDDPGDDPGGDPGDDPGDDPGNDPDGDDPNGGPGDDGTGDDGSDGSGVGDVAADDAADDAGTDASPSFPVPDTGTTNDDGVRSGFGGGPLPRTGASILVLIASATALIGAGAALRGWRRPATGPGIQR